MTDGPPENLNLHFLLITRPYYTARMKEGVCALKLTER
jgi:hypothetical protein